MHPAPRPPSSTLWHSEMLEFQGWHCLSRSSSAGSPGRCSDAFARGLGVLRGMRRPSFCAQPPRQGCRLFSACGGGQVSSQDHRVHPGSCCGPRAKVCTCRVGWDQAPEAPTSGTFTATCRFSLSIYSPSSEPSWACSWAVFLGWTDCLAPLAPGGGPTWGHQAGGGGSGCN